MREDADVRPRLFSRTVNVGDAVTLEMVRNPASNRTGALEWRKDGVVLQGQTALTLSINNVQSSDEGIYECYYDGAYSDRKQGIMRLIVRACTDNKYGSDCSNDCPDCYNGGVCHDQTGECVCPPGFSGTYCGTACASGRFGKTCRFSCSGGCQGQLMTVPDPVGCTCPPGLTGMTCQDACPDGTYGASCTQNCHCLSGNSACHKETGACTGGCAAGWEGDSCQIRPATVTQPPMDQTINIGSQATFTCSSTGVPTPAITWYNDSSAITPGGQISVVKVTEVVDGENVVTSTLTITSVGREDNGVYKCASSNANGVYMDTSQVARLTVRERPDDVKVTVTAVNSTALQVTWTVGVTGNLDIIDSQVRYRSFIDGEWTTYTPWRATGISGTNGTVRISGLLPAVSYHVQVTVRNALGLSTPPSWAWGITNEAPPGPPHGLQVAQISHNTVHLTWQPSLRTNGVIRSYTVQYGESVACETLEFSPKDVTTSDNNNSTTTVIGDLVPYTNYTFRVRGATSAGGGDFSHCNVTRTLEYYPTAPVVQTFADQHDCNCRTPNIPRPVQLRVAWRRPDHIYGQLQAYRISLYNRTGGEPFYQENMTSGLQQENLTAVVTSSLLQPANNYSVTVSAINTVYLGSESHPYIARASDGYDSEPGTSYAPLGLDQQQWSKSLAELPANSLVRVTVRAVTCAEGDKGEEVTCRVSRVGEK
ncbi:PREDICTED: angiopoietin-1 receptor-like [Branchiostoma belcheri]|uniref:Angiopoietin-1 receptor-like n=1 Tax=Branchiostoma belcheri TaxID=7741 RepID=A0A6P4YBX2_BRABE|nr:PREDICTED: angiopoietin-1 receptor-like [Branchiostoma belcheri]